MGRLKTNDERFLKKMRKNKPQELCKTGHHQESTKEPGVCVHCGLKKITKDCKDVG